MSARAPFLTKVIRIGLVGFGASGVVSAIVNIVGAYQLIEPSDEQSLGITRNEIVGWYIVPLLGGGLLIYLGLRRWKAREPSVR